MSNKYFCILGGGGIRGAAYTGAIKALKELNLEITGFAGSSIGAVVASLLTFGYKEEEIQKIFNGINFEFFNDINLNFGKDFAISRGSKFYEWIKDKIEEKFYQDKENKEKLPVKFKDIDKELIIFSVDLTTSKFHEFSKQKTPDVEIAQAIRISVAMPGLYAPVFNEDECLVDGDLLKSVPLWKISETINKKEEKILEFRLEGNETKKKIKNTFEYLNAVYDTVSGVASDYIINTYKNCDRYDYIKIDLNNISVVDFMINDEKKKSMSKIGYETTMKYFKEFYPQKRRKLDEIYKKLLSDYKKINYLIKNGEIDEAKYEIADIFSKILPEKEIIDKKIISEIVLNKNLFDENHLIKNGLFGKKVVLIDKNLVLNNLETLTQKIENKLK